MKRQLLPTLFVLMGIAGPGFTHEGDDRRPAEQAVIVSMLKELQAEVRLLRREVQDLRRMVESGRTPERQDEPVRVEDLKSEINQRMRMIARSEVELERVEKNRSQMREQLTRAAKEIATLEKALKENAESYEFGGRRFSAAQVREDLERRIDRNQLTKKHLEQTNLVAERLRQSLAKQQAEFKALVERRKEIEVREERKRE